MGQPGSVDGEWRQIANFKNLSQSGGNIGHQWLSGIFRRRGLLAVLAPRGRHRHTASTSSHSYWHWQYRDFPTCLIQLRCSKESTPPIDQISMLIKLQWKLLLPILRTWVRFDMWKYFWKNYTYQLGYIARKSKKKFFTFPNKPKAFHPPTPTTYPDIQNAHFKSPLCRYCSHILSFCDSSRGKHSTEKCKKQHQYWWQPTS